MLRQNPTDLLKIPSENGLPVNEYRIHQGQVEFRSLERSAAGAWKALDAGDLEMHFVLNTVVARWLMERLGALPDAESKTAFMSPLDST